MKDTTYYTHYKGEYIQVLPVEKCVKSILSRIESYEDTIKRLKEENRKLKDEVWKDEELQDMKEQLDNMKSNYHRGFNITEEEDATIKEWKKARRRSTQSYDPYGKNEGTRSIWWKVLIYFLSYSDRVFRGYKV